MSRSTSTQSSLFLILIIIGVWCVSQSLAAPPLLTGIDQNQLKICTIGNFPIILTGIGFVNNANAQCRFTSQPETTVNISVTATYINSTNVKCMVPDRMANGLSLNVLLSVTNDRVEYSNFFEIRYSGNYAWAGNVFLTGHDPDFHATSGNGSYMLAKSLEYVTKGTWNNLSAPGFKKFLFVESKLPATGPDVKASLPSLISLGLTNGLHFDHVNDTEFRNAALSNYCALVIASSGGGLLTTRELRALNDRKQDIAYFLKQGGGLAAYAEGIGSFTTSKNLPGITDATPSEAFAFLPITVGGSPVIVPPYLVTPLGVNLFGFTAAHINDPSHSTFKQTGGLSIITYDANNTIVTLAGQINPCTDDCNGNGVCSCGECSCKPGYSGAYCECLGSSTCNVCGDGIIQSGELCDGGIGCLSNCTCGAGYEVTEPISPKCQVLRIPRVTAITKAPTQGGTVMVNATNLGVDAGAIVLKIDNVLCANPTFVDANKAAFYCTAPSGSGVSGVLTIAAAGRNGDGLNQPLFAYNPPTITTMQAVATSGNVPLVISGTNFGDQINKVTVTIDGNNCPVTSASHTSLTCTAPAGSGYNRAVSITVNTQVATSLYAYSKPTITSITKSDTTGGVVTLTGTSFGTSSAVRTIALLPGLSCTNLQNVIDHTTLVCTVVAGSGTGYFATLTVDGLTSDSIAFSYNAPTIDANNKPIPPTIGGITTIYGTNFFTDSSRITVQIGSGFCTGIQIVTNHVAIKCNAPAGTGSTTAIVTVNGQSSLPTTILYGPPVITSVGTTTTAGGTVSISGSGFGTNAAKVAVAVGGQSCPITSITDSTVVITVPVGTGGGKDVLIIVDGQSYTKTQGFSYQAPSISNPSSLVSSGGSLVISGTSLGAKTSVTSVTVNGSPCSVVSSTHTTVTCTLSSGTGVNYDVIVIVDGLVSNTAKFSYLPPTITSVDSIETAGGDISIKGTNFGQSTSTVSVTIGSLPCPVVSAAHSYLICTAPVGSGINKVVTLVAGSQTATSSFSYKPPVLTQATPVETQGGFVTLIGKSLGAVDTPRSVLVSSDLPCDSLHTSTEHYMLVCTMRQGTGANYNVSVTVDGQKSNNVIFSYNIPSIAHKIKPPPTVGGQIMVMGTDFGDSEFFISVKIGQGWCTNITLVTPHSELTCNAPAGTGSSTPISIIVNGQSSTISLMGYQAPNITSVNRIQTIGGIVTVGGFNFGTNKLNTLVTINNSPCAILSTAESSITCQYGAGTGVGYDVSVTVDGQTSTLPSSFSYEGPVINTATSVPSGGGITSIGGSNFGNSIALTSVVVNGQPCPVVSVVDNLIACQAVSGTGLGYNVSVIVNTQSNNAPYIFSYSKPTISSSTSVTTKGGLATLTGNSFGTDKSLVVVAINNVEAIVEQVSHTQLIVNVAEGFGKDLPIMVNVDYQANIDNAKFSYEAPTIISSTSSSTSGSEITLTGTSFNSIGNTISITIDGKVCANARLTISHTEAICTAMAGSGINHPLVITSGGQSSQPFMLAYGLPTVSRSTKASTNGGDVVTIQGANLGSLIQSVTISGKPCTSPNVTVIDHEFVCIAPSGTGSNNIIQVTVDGQQSVDQARFSYVNPSITDSTRPAPIGNTLITVNGQNFGSNSGVLSVSVDGKPCSTPLITKPHIQLTCSAPSSTGNKTIIVTVDGLQGSSQIYYQPSKVFTSTSSPTSGNHKVTISGQSFGSDSSLIQVLIGGKSCSNVALISSDSQLTCTSPSGSGSQVSVQVNVDSIEGTVANVFTYDAPVVESSTSCLTSGGKVTISGSNFGTDASKISSLVNSQNCLSVSVVTPHTAIECVAGPGLGFNKEIKVTVDGLVSEVNSIFAYTAPIILSATSLGKRVLGNVTITGHSFGNDSNSIGIQIDGNDCFSPVLLINHESIQCTYYPQMEGFDLPVNVTVAKQTSFANVFSVDDFAKCDDPTCSGNGRCIGGVCSCNSPFYGPKCSEKFDEHPTDGNQPEVIVNTTKPDSTIRLPTNETINIFIKEIRELDLVDNVLRVIPVSEMKWNVTISATEESLKWDYNLSIPDAGDVKVLITYFLQNKVIDFAGQNISMPRNNVKFNIDIFDWKYIGGPNTYDDRLQIIMTSHVQGTPNNCKEDQVGLNSNQDDTQLHWFQFNQNGHSLYGRFSNRAVADNRIMPVSQRIDRRSPDGREIDVAINAPFFSKKLNIDPDFSVIMGTSTISTDCSDGTKKVNKWYIPFAVVMGVASAAAVVGTVIWRKKRKQENSLTKTLHSIGSKA